MGRYLIKLHKDLDLYAEWSTGVDAPLFVGSRQEITKYLKEHLALYPITAENVETRLDRADERGSSMLATTCGYWDDEGLIPCTHKGQRWLRRERLGAYCLLVIAGDEEGAYLLTEPFEDQVDDSDSAKLSRVVEMIRSAAKDDLDVLSLQALKHAAGVP